MEGHVRPLIAAVVVLGVALRVAASFAIPPATVAVSCAPDEVTHVRTVATLRLWEKAERRPGEPIYGVFPPLQYLPQWLALRAGSNARLGSLFWSVLTMLALCATVSHWTRSRGEIALAALAAALYPQLAFVGSYVNGDAATIAAGALLGAAISRWASQGEGDEGVAPVGFALGLVLVMKPSGWFSILPACCWMGWAAARRKPSLRSLAAAAAGCAAVALPILAWNAYRMNGDAFGLRHFASFMATEWTGAPGARTPHALARMVKDLALSSVGDFRNMNLPLPAPLVAAVWLFLLAGGWAAWRKTPPGPARRAALWLAACLAINLAMVIYECWFVDFQPQGRYLMPALLWLCLAAILIPFEGQKRTAWRAGCVAILAAGSAGMLLLLFRHPCT